MKSIIRQAAGIVTAFFFGAALGHVNLFKHEKQKRQIGTVCGLSAASVLSFGLLEGFRNLMSLMVFIGTMTIGHEMTQGYWRWYVEKTYAEGGVLMAYALLKRMGVSENKIRELDKATFPRPRASTESTP